MHGTSHKEQFFFKSLQVPSFVQSKKGRERERRQRLLSAGMEKGEREKGESEAEGSWWSFHFPCLLLTGTETMKMFGRNLLHYAYAYVKVDSIDINP